MSDYISIGKFARSLGVHVDTVRAWCNSGKINYIVTPGGQRRISATENAFCTPDNTLLQEAPTDRIIKALESSLDATDYIITPHTENDE